MGDFNNWDKTSHALRQRDSSGVWEAFVPGMDKGVSYKYSVSSRYHGYRVDKADPFAFYTSKPPDTTSIVWDLDYTWGDHEWMAKRQEHNGLNAPISIYEVHLGSWRRVPEEAG